VSNDCRVKEGSMTEADTDGTVAAVLIMTAGAGPGARAEGDRKPCKSHIALGQWLVPKPICDVTQCRPEVFWVSKLHNLMLLLK